MPRKPAASSTRLTRLTLPKLNAELAQRGVNARLAKADGYFYFWSGEAADWLDRTVRVERLNDLMLDQWLEEYRKLKARNNELLGRKQGGRRRHAAPARGRRA